MPDSGCHLVVAGRNRRLIDQLLTSNEFPEWVAVVAFYRALHLVDAALFHDHRDRHGGDHSNRLRILKTTNRYNNIYRSFRKLFAASLVARYLESDESGEVRAFDEYLTPAQVRDVIVNHHLRQIEMSTARFMPTPPPASPG